MSRLSRIGLPLSIVSSTARRRECFCTCLASAYRYRARACGVSACHAGKALRAALTAASTSASDPCATLAILSPVEGSAVSKYCPAAGCNHAPFTKCPNRALMLVEPRKHFLRVFRRRAVLHRDKFFGNAHEIVSFPSFVDSV